ETQTTWREQLLTAIPTAKGLTGLGASDVRRPMCEIGEEYLQLPQAAELRMLDFGISASSYDCRRVAQATHLTNLAVIDLCGAHVDDRCVEELIGATHLRSLVALRLGGNSDSGGLVTEDGIELLTASPNLVNLRQLVLCSNDEFGDVALRRLLAW